MDQQKLRLMFTGGGSGGPTTPLLGLAETFKDHEEYSMEFLFLGTSRGPERRMVEEFGMSYQAIPAGKFRRYWDWKNLSDPFLVFAGFFTEFIIFSSFVRRSSSVPAVLPVFLWPGRR